jgi:PTH1 family peptidyl-tRNA hydrolase
LILIAGLGNPGSRYELTRHNIGFLVIDKLARLFKVKSFKTENNYQASLVHHNKKAVVLLKPLTYMNLSGLALKEFTDKFDVYAENVLIIFDDVSLDFGTLRLRPSGSDGGQKGMHSIIYELQTEEIPRLRIGVRNADEIEKYKAAERNYLADFVLSGFAPDEMKHLDTVINTAAETVISFIDKGIKETMNKFNRNVREPESPDTLDGGES